VVICVPKIPPSWFFVTIVVIIRGDLRAKNPPSWFFVTFVVIIRVVVRKKAVDQIMKRTNNI